MLITDPDPQLQRLLELVPPRGSRATTSPEVDPLERLKQLYPPASLSRQPASPAAEGGDPASTVDRMEALLRRGEAAGQMGSDTIQPRVEPAPLPPPTTTLPPVVVEERGVSTPLVSQGAGGTWEEPDLPIGEAVANAAKRGSGQILESLAGAAAMFPADPMIEAMGGERTPLEQTAVGKTIAAAQGFQERNPASPSVESGGPFQPANPRWWLERGVEQAPQMLLALGAAVGTGGGLAAFALPTALQEGGSAYMQNREALLAAGDDLDTAEMKARGAGLLTGAGAAALERIPGSVFLLNKIPGADRIFAQSVTERLVKTIPGRLAAGAGAEGITEAAQEAWADVVEYAATQDPATFADWQQRYMGSGALGGLVGGATNVAMGALPGPQDHGISDIENSNIPVPLEPALPQAVTPEPEPIIVPVPVPVEPNAGASPSIEVGQPETPRPRTYVPDPETGAVDLIRLEEDRLERTQLPAGPVRMLAEEEIKPEDWARRLTEVQKRGYESNEAYVREVLRGHNEIYQGSAPSRIILVRRTNGGESAIAELVREGDGFEVFSWGPKRPYYLRGLREKGKLLWEGPDHQPPASADPNAPLLPDPPSTNQPGGGTSQPVRPQQPTENLAGSAPEVTPDGPSNLFGETRPPTVEQGGMFTDRDFAAGDRARADEISSRPMDAEDVAANTREAPPVTERDADTGDIDFDRPPAPTPPEAKTATYRKTRGAAKALTDKRLLDRYRAALREATLADAGAAAYEGRGGRIKRDYADGETAIGVAGTGAGSFQRGRQTQASARLRAYEDELRARKGLKIPTLEQAFAEAQPSEIPEALRTEFAELRQLDDDTVLERWGMAEENANSQRANPITQIRRALYAAEAERRGFDLDEEAADLAEVGSEEGGLPFDPDTDRIARQRQLAERDAERDPTTIRIQRAVSSSRSLGDPAERGDPLAPPESSESFSRKMKGRLEAAEEKVKRTNAPAVIEALSKVVKAAGANVPIRTGRLGTRNALGIFKIDPEVIRVLEANNIPTAAHEVGHAIEKAIYGWPSGGPWKNPRVGRPIQKELRDLGYELYGDTKPYGGYKREGWAEFTRLWVTEPDVAREKAPRLARWFEETFSKEAPKVRAALDEARAEIERWQQQGSKARVEESIIDPAAPKERLKKAAESAKQAVTMEQWIEMGQPIADLAAAAEEKLGAPLKTEENPFTAFSAWAMTHATRVRYMVEHAMIDLSGNAVGPGLHEIRALVKGRRKDFTVYLYARRAVKLWTDPKGQRNPGISLIDAREVIRQLETPEFQLAAEKVYAWNDGVLDYAAEASSDFAKVVEAIRERDPGDYIPLQREFDQLDEMFARSGGVGSAARGNLVKRLEGSGRRIKDPFPAMIAKTEGLVRQAHRRRIIELIIKLGEVEGLGHIIEEVPVRQAPVAATTISDLIERIERELFGSMGKAGSVNIDNPFGLGIDLGQYLTFFAPAQSPGGTEAIVPVWRDGKVRWFQVDPALYAALDGLDVYRLPQTAGLLGAGVKALEKTAEVFRAGTTGMRASFGLVVNPSRDLQTLWVNSRASGSGRELFGAYLSAMGHAALYRTTGKNVSPYYDAFIRLGGEMSQSLGQDIPHTRRAAHRLFQGRVARTVDPRNWFDFYRDLVQFPESAPRTAELKLVARDVGWEPGQNMTLAQSLELLVAAKQVTVDFSAAGRFTRAMNRTWNFFNVSFQGPRAMVRAAMRDPAKFALRGISGITIPSLLLWWDDKDEEWWNEIPYTDRLLNWYVPFDNPFTGAPELAQIPKSHDAATLFASMPVMFADAWYREEPEQAKAFFAEAFNFLSPVSEPEDLFSIGGPLAREGAQQVANRNFFFDTPIVSRGMERMPAEEQFNEYTSSAAITIGKALGVSPQRVDHAIRNVVGPAASDAVEVFGFGPPDLGREKELADLPVAGRLFRRGGQEGSRLKSVDDLYNELEEAQRRQASVSNPETEPERQRRLQLEDATSAIQALSVARRQVKRYAQRQELTRDIALISQDAIGMHREGRLARTRFQNERRRAERLKETVSKQPASATRR